MKIGNIIYENELVNHKEVDFINYHKINENTSTVQKDVDYSLPTLIVGWKFLKEKYPNVDANILKHKVLDKKLYWEFSFDENKSSHVNGILNFVENLPYYYYSTQYKYTNLDPIFFNLRDNDELFDVLPKEIDSFYLFKNRMLYVLVNKEIYGLDIEMYRFFKFNVKGLVDRLQKKINGSAIFDPEGEYYKEYYKKFPDFSYLKRYLVVIMSK